MPAVRAAVVAGLFYPDEPESLRAEVARYLDDVPPPAAPGLPKLLIVPHAGYVYSGPVAAHAYARLAELEGRISRVVLLGPAHRFAVRGLALPATATAFDTPFGEVPLDADGCAALADLPQVKRSDDAHEREHSLEVQLPFLQRMLGDFELVPLVVGAATADDVAAVLERLWGGDETLIVISSDLSHYLPYADARAIDHATVQRILGLDATLDHHEACGATPINGALLAARRHGLAPRLLDLRNSGDTAGDRSRVVGYCAIEFDHPPAAARGRRDQAGSSADDPTLGPPLLARARNAIALRLGLPPALPEPPHPRLAERGATFVSLHRDGELRGCIGRLRAVRPLDEDVRCNAVAAAFDDERCRPCTADEFDQLEIEVSLLGPQSSLPTYSERAALRALRPGIDGVVLRWRDRHATLLPQVWSTLPDPAEFMAALKRKAGLTRDFWALDVELSRYRVQRFEEPREHAR